MRGTPGSGKTVLLHLLHRQIRKTYPQAFIRRFDSWLPQGKIEFPSIESRLREVDPRYPRDQISFLLLDDAQDTYWDKLLWIDFLKEVHGGMSTYRVALFCSYGSYTSRTFDSPGTSFKLRAAACFSLRPSIGSSYGILYSHKDFFQVVKRFDPVFAKLDKKLLERIYEWTAGHAGAVFELLHFIQEVSIT